MEDIEFIFGECSSLSKKEYRRSIKTGSLLGVKDLWCAAVYKLHHRRGRFGESELDLQETD